MRAVLITVLVVLTGVVCGGKSSGPKPATAAVASFPAAACSTLTEAEVMQFSKILPTFNAALKAANWKPTPSKPGGGPVNALVTLVEGMNAPGVEESLKAAGSNWGTFRSTLYKVFAASAALSVEAVDSERAAQMKQDTTPTGRRAFGNYQAAKEACSALPAGNIEVVRNHLQVLQALRTVGR
jgi:hypothetical protein